MSRSVSRGFTLAEVIVAAGGMLIIGLVLLVAYRTTFNALMISTSRATVTARMQTTLERLERDVHQARALAPACSVFSNSPGDAVTSGKLVLDAPNVDGTAGDRVIYTCLSACTPNNPGVLRRIVATAANGCVQPWIRDQALARDVVLVGYPVAAGRDVQVDLQVRQASGGFTAASRVVATYTFRNE